MEVLIRMLRDLTLNPLAPALDTTDMQPVSATVLRTKLEDAAKFPFNGRAVVALTVQEALELVSLLDATRRGVQEP